MAYPTKLVSVTKSGVKGTAPSGIDGDVVNPVSGSVSLDDEMGAIGQSSNGRFIVFASDANNFVTQPDEQLRDIYLKDMQTGDLSLVTPGIFLSDARFPNVSDDGRYVVFEANDRVYLRDMTQASAEVISRDENGLEINGFNPHMSANGRYVVFNSEDGVGGNTFQQVYLRDLELDVTTLVSIDGETMGNKDSENAFVSNDGKIVIFQSESDNFTAGNANANAEVFVKNMETGSLTRASENQNGEGGVTTATVFPGSQNAMLSANGRYVVFESTNNDFVPISNSVGNNQILSAVYRKDLVTGQIELVSQGKDGTAAASAENASITADGRFVLFKTIYGATQDGSLTPNNIDSGSNGGTLNPNYLSFYYVKDMATGDVYNIDLARGTLQFKQTLPFVGTITTPKVYLAPYLSYNAIISADGKSIVLSSTQDLVAGKPKAYVLDQNGGNTGDDLQGNNDEQYDVFRIDISSITSKAVKPQNVTGEDDANDTLIGGFGSDKLKGLGGDDTYQVEIIQSGTGAKATAKMKHSVLEDKNDGTDTIVLLGSVDIAKPALISVSSNVENLDASQTGSTLLNLKGSNDANQITGNSADNLIDGMSGNDTLIGGAGNDTLIGGVGDDELAGGAGDDTYVLNVKLEEGFVVVADGDTYTEETDEGIDIIAYSGLIKLAKDAEPYTFNLADPEYTNFEGIDLTGTGKSANLNLLGTMLDNILIGNAADNQLDGGAGNDTLDGGLGADEMIGGAGDDTYVIDNVGDIATEEGEGDTDTVKVSLSKFVLADDSNIENIIVISKGSAKITGSSGNNDIQGNEKASELNGGAGNDTINGGAGNDKLTGGAGDDVFVFDTALKGNLDTITDFGNGADRIDLDATIFSELAVGELDADNFVVGKKATTADHHIIYDSVSGGLFYDADGSGKGAAIKFASFSKVDGAMPDLDATDIFVI